MKARQILERKASQAVETITADQTLANAAALLTQRNIGALVAVDSDGGVAGILSERDVVRALAKNGPDALNTRVGDVMTTSVQTCALDDDDGSLIKRMSEGRFRHLPVVKDSALIGLISIGDVVSARMAALQRENEALEDMIRSATA